jgi:hypothetical protein
MPRNRFETEQKHTRNDVLLVREERQRTHVASSKRGTTMAGSPIIRRVVALVLCAVATGTPARALDGFPAAVDRILSNQTDGRISSLSPERKRRLIDCVNDVLAGMPNGMQRFVLAAADYEDMEDRFGEVLLENRAEWKQSIARSCAQHAV